MTEDYYYYLDKLGIIPWTLKKSEPFLIFLGKPLQSEKEVHLFTEMLKVIGITLNHVQIIESNNNPKWLICHNISIYHPEYLLKNLSDKAKAYQDLKTVKNLRLSGVL